MCADCATPAHKHGYVSPPFDYPCPAWPGQRAIHEKMMQMLETFRHRDAGRSDAPPRQSPNLSPPCPQVSRSPTSCSDFRTFRSSIRMLRFAAVVRIAGSCGRHESKAGASHRSLLCLRLGQVSIDIEHPRRRSRLGHQNRRILGQAAGRLESQVQLLVVITPTNRGGDRELDRTPAG